MGDHNNKYDTPFIPFQPVHISKMSDIEKVQWFDFLIDNKVKVILMITISFITV